MTLVSICIPTFNSEQYITETLDSARKQTFEDIEIIVVDNCSTDSTVEICSNAGKADSRITVHKNERNIGLSGNLNKCLELARGEYVKLLPSDDWLEPVCIERMVEVFTSYPSATVVGCSTKVIDENGEFVAELAPYRKSELMPGHQIMKRMLLEMQNHVGPPASVLMRRHSYGCGFNRSLFQLLDMEMWLRALEQGDYCYVNEPLAALRKHTKSGSSVGLKTALFVADMLQLAQTYESFVECEGISNQMWWQIIDGHILLNYGQQTIEERINLDEVGYYVHKLKNIVGDDNIDCLLEVMAKINLYTLSRLCNSDIGLVLENYKEKLSKNSYELSWNKDEVQRLTQEINAMTNTITWKCTQPLRELKSRLLGSVTK